MSPRSELATLRRCHQVWEAEILRDRLVAAGIRAFIHGGESAHSLSYVGVALGGVRVQVPTEDLGRAEEVLVEDERQRVRAGRWRCPRCGEPNDPAFDICYSCSLPRDERAEVIGPSEDDEDLAAGYARDSASESLGNGLLVLTPPATPREDGNPYRAAAPVVGDTVPVMETPRIATARHPAAADVHIALMLALATCVIALPLFPLLSMGFLIRGWIRGAASISSLRWKLVAVLLFDVVLLALIGGIVAAVFAAEPPARVPSITAAEQLALEQIDQMVARGEADEAVRLIVRTMDESGERLVAVASGVPSTEREPAHDRDRGDADRGDSGAASGFTRFVPLRMYLQDRLMRWGVVSPEILAAYREGTDGAAEAALAQVERSRDLSEADRLLERYFATRSGDEALLLAADLAFERRWYWRAIGYLRRIDARWQFAGQGAVAADVAALPWELVLARVDESDVGALADAVAERAAKRGAWPLGTYQGADVDQAAVGVRLVVAYRAVGEVRAAERMAAMVRAWYGDRRVLYGGAERTVDEALARVMDGKIVGGGDPDAAGDWATLGRSAERVYRTAREAAPEPGALSPIPLWVREIPDPVYDTMQMPLEPPVGWSAEDAARVFPVVHRDRVLVQVERRLYAFQLADGRVWPAGGEWSEGSTGEAVYRDPERDDTVPQSGRMPVGGEPQFSLSAERGRVAGRFGPEPSGWAPVLRPQGAMSRVALLDLEREGQMVDGYPARAERVADGARAEFEGAPLIVGPRMFVGLTRRDDAVVESSVVGLDLASGRLLFRSAALFAARPLGVDAGHRLADSLVSYREGILYYHGDSGGVAALDAVDGTVLWILRYPRAELDSGAYPQRRRGARVRSAPVALLGPLALASPADSDRLLAIDPLDGRLLWATGAGQAGEVDQILGEVDGRVIAGGDALYWLRREDGALVAQWPATGTDQPHGALVAPRRGGRGVLAGETVYWPTEQAIWCFDAALGERVADGEPRREGESLGGSDVLDRRVWGLGGGGVRPLRRVDLAPLGMRGGDLISGGGMLVMSLPGRLVAFAGAGSPEDGGDAITQGERE